MIVPGTAFAAPVTTPPETILTEDFESTTPTQYTVSKLVANPADGNRWWGRITRNKRTGTAGLWCNGSPYALTSWPTNYTLNSSGVASFTVPQLADYYSAQLGFYYNMPSLGQADTNSFTLHWRPVGVSRASAIYPFPKTTTAAPWRYYAADLGTDSEPISRRAGEIWFQWVDRRESGTQSVFVGVGPTIDDVTIAGWRYGPARSVQATPAHRTAIVSWQTPLAAVGSSEVDTRTIMYDVWRRPTSSASAWTLAAATYATSLTDSGLTPATGYTYAVQARDEVSGYGQSVSIATTTTNAAPLASPDTYTVAEDSSITVAAPGPLSNDSDPDGDPMTAERISGPTRGTLSLLSTGAFSYTPSPDFNGIDSFTYKAKDAFGGSANSTVTITVTPVNDAPVAVSDSSFIAEDSTLTAAAPGLLANDTDIDGGALSASLVSPPSNGTVTVNADGSYSYRPAPNFNGNDSFTYKVYDGQTYSAPTTVSVRVDPVNDAPVAAPDAGEIDEDTTLTVGAATGLLLNDSDIDGNPLTAVVGNAPANGTVSISANGAYTYRPAANFNGTDSFTYRAYDGQAYSAPATVTITVKPVNDAPVAIANTGTVAEDTTLTVGAPGLLGNDTDVDGGALMASVVQAPSSGSVTVNADGSYTYRPVADFNGTDSFTYRAYDGQEYSAAATVTITVTPVNDAPVAVTDTYSATEDVTLTVNATGVLANDTDIDGNPLTAVIFSSPANGAVTLNSNGSFTYRPALNFNGTDSFVYRAFDGQAYSAPVAVTINVAAVNDAPVAVPDFVGARPGQPLMVSAANGVLVNDVDVDGDLLTAELVSGASHGTVVLLPNGSYTYDPGPGFVSTDSFTYRAKDATHDSAVTTVLITANNDAPVARDDSAVTAEDQSLEATSVLANDTDADNDGLAASLLQGALHGTVTLRTDGTFTYTPVADFNGTDRFTYRAFDGAAYSSAATVTIQVTPVNDAPISLPDEYSMDEDGLLTVVPPSGVLSNDFDVETAPLLTAQLVSAPSSGNLDLHADGTFVYVPAANFSGTVSFTYRASDGSLTSAPSTVTILVRPVNDPPVGVADSHETKEDETLIVAAPGLLGNDSDVENDPLVAVPFGNPAHGTALVGENGSLVYVPEPNYHGVDQFTYLVSDGLAFSQPVSVTITVTPVNDAPVARDDEVTIDEDEVRTINVLANDNDVDSASLSVRIESTGAGTVQAGAVAGTFLYQPKQDSVATDVFTYSVADSDGSRSGLATVTIHITPVNDAPAASPNDYPVEQDASITVAPPGVLANDSDVDDVNLSAILVTGPAHGALQFGPDGGFTYTPEKGFLGQDSFVYQASDGRLFSTPTTVTLTVTQSAGVVTRVAGYDRYAVAEALARRGWDPAGDKSWPGVTDVIIANGENGKEADPLAAAGLAGAYNAPVLLIQATRIPNQTRRALAEIAAENPGVRVHVIGGKVTVPPARWTELKAIPGVSQTDYRVEGRDRYDVTAIIAQRMVSKLESTGGDVSGALIINVESSAAFYDALAVSPQAYDGNWAMLGVRAGSVPPQVASVLKGAMAGKPRHVVNATGFVGAAVYSATGATARYSSTTDRYSSAPLIADKVTANSSCSSRETGIAAMLPDALTGGVFLGKQRGVMLFTDSTNVLRKPARDYISLHGNDTAQGWVFGGEKSIPAAQEITFAGLID